MQEMNVEGEGNIIGHTWHCTSHLQIRTFQTFYNKFFFLLIFLFTVVVTVLHARTKPKVGTVSLEFGEECVLICRSTIVRILGGSGTSLTCGIAGECFLKSESRPVCYLPVLKLFIHWFYVPVKKEILCFIIRHVRRLYVHTCYSCICPCLEFFLP